MSDNNSEKEINLLDVLAYFYLFFHKRWLLILSITVVFSILAIVKEYSSPRLEKYYEAKIKISSNFFSTDIIDNAAQKIYLGQTGNEDFLVKSGFTKDIASQIKEIRKSNEKTLEDTSVYLLLSAKTADKIEDASNQLITIIGNQDILKNKITKIEKFRKEYLAKINTKINEIESFNKLLTSSLSIKNENFSALNNFSNKEYLFLIEKKFYVELNSDVNPINHTILSVSEVKNAPGFKRIIIQNIFIGFVLGSIFAFIFEIFRKVKTRAMGLNNASWFSK
ncbi:MAG: hypothetical protein WCK02_04730 [Bacteroidota bacterium]